MTSIFHRQRDVPCKFSWRDHGCGVPCIVSDFGFVRLNPRDLPVDPVTLCEGDRVRCEITETSLGLEATSIVLDDSDAFSCDEIDSDDTPLSSDDDCTDADSPVVVHSRIVGLVAALEEDGGSGSVLTDRGDFRFLLDYSRSSGDVFCEGDEVTCDLVETGDGLQAVNLVSQSAEPSVALLVTPATRRGVVEEFARWLWTDVATVLATAFLAVPQSVLQASRRLLATVRASRAVRRAVFASCRLLRYIIHILAASRRHAGELVLRMTARRRPLARLLSEDSANGGFDPDRFVDVSEAVLSQLICPVCRCVLQHPVTTPCDHLFCRACLRRSLQVKPECPMDKRWVREEDMKDAPHYVRNLLEGLRLRCEFADVGCGEVVSVREVEGHERRCPHRQSVEFLTQR